MSYQVKVAPEAKFLLADASEWWSEHRPAARARVVDEYFRLVNILADSPNSGSLHETRRGQEVRRLRLLGTPYYLYYIVSDEERQVLVVSLWSAMRGKGPPP